MAGGYSKEVTPDPIPNSVVKLFRVDGTACRLWESRSPPAFFYALIVPKAQAGLFYVRVIWITNIYPTVETSFVFS